MKKLKYQLFACLPLSMVGLLLTAIIFSCQKKPLERFVPDRMFTPTGINVTGGDTAVTISWPASLFSAGSGVTYTLEISEDSTFQSSPALTLVVDSTSRTITDDSLMDRKPYFARVKANKTQNAAESGWVEADTHFTLVGVQIFHPILPTDIIDNSVILNWNPTPRVNKILFTAANGDTVSVAVSEDENAAGQKIIAGLKASTFYSAEIYAGNKSKGIITFTTKAKVTGNNVIDLRDITDRPQVLFDTLPQIPDGSIVLLKRGLSYTIPSAYTFDKSVTIMSGLGNIGSRSAEILSNGFNANIIASDPYIDKERFKQFNATEDTLEELVTRSNAILFHCPLTEETKRMLGKKQFASMQKGVVLVNTCRGELVDEDALYDALQNGLLGAYATDVVEAEPITGNHRLAKLDNVIITPHLGGYSWESLYGMGQTCVDDCVSVLENNGIAGELANPEVLKKHR